MANLNAEMKNLVCRGVGLLRINHITHMVSEYKDQAMVLLNTLEKDLYDLIDGKETDVVVAPGLPLSVDAPVEVITTDTTATPVKKTRRSSAQIEADKAAKKAVK